MNFFFYHDKYIISTLKRYNKRTYLKKKRKKYRNAYRWWKHIKEITNTPPFLVGFD